MKKALLLILLLPLFGFGQLIDLESNLYDSDTFRCATWFIPDVVPCTYYSNNGDTIEINFWSTAFNGVQFTYTQQKKTSITLNIKYDVLRSDAGSARTYIGLFIYKDGSVVDYNAPDIISYALNYNYKSYVGQAIGTYERSITTDLSNYPTYDSLLIHTMMFYAGEPSGSGAYMKFHKNDFYVADEFTDSGLADSVIFDNVGIVGFDSDLWLPDTLYVAEGNNVKLYNDNVAYIPANKKTRVTFDWTCSVGNETSIYYEIDGGVAVGTYAITCRAQNEIGNYTDIVTSVIKVEAKAALGAKVILAIGNSLTSGGWARMKPVIDDSLNVTLTSVGNQGTAPNLHAGDGGATFLRFIGATSLLATAGVLDVPTYVADSIASPPDIIRVSLGINDCFGVTAIATIMTNAQTLIDSLLSGSSAKIIICLPTTASNTVFGWMTNYSNFIGYETYILRVRALNKLIHSTYGYGAYDVRVNVAYDTMVLDRDGGYPKVSGLHSNGLHPNQTGYEELINGTLNVINHIYQ